jgi:putative FmdB family regulatory protein
MCQYVFHCRDCNKEFTVNLHMADRGSSPVACPHCSGEQVEQLVTAFSAVTSKKSYAARFLAATPNLPPPLSLLR